MMKVFVTGDTHGQTSRRIKFSSELRRGDALIILGDSGFNYYLDERDQKEKRRVQDTGIIIYCVRGNHEERPENIETMIKCADEEIKGIVYLEPEYPNIKYLIDGNIYYFNGHRTLVIGGAYSVDKHIRLKRQGDYKWFPQEQLSKKEMREIEEAHSGEEFDFVLTHTCPESWIPKDLFTSMDQSTVDTSMEQWLEKFRHKIRYNVWLCGHFHDDRYLRPCVEMFYADVGNLEDIYRRWVYNNFIPWYLNKEI